MKTVNNNAAVIDCGYVLKYSEYFNKLGKDPSTDKALKLIKIITQEITKADVLPGVPRWSENRKAIVSSGFSEVTPGIDFTTWCIYPVYRVLKFYRYDVNLIVDEKYHHIGYTDGNEMAGLFQKNCTEIEYTEAQQKANNGDVVGVAAFGKNGKAGHVGIVAPNILPVKNKSKIIVGQAGWINGFFPIYSCFPKSLVTEPKFYILPKVK